MNRTEATRIGGMDRQTLRDSRHGTSARTSIEAIVLGEGAAGPDELPKPIGIDAARRTDEPPGRGCLPPAGQPQSCLILPQPCEIIARGERNAAKTRRAALSHTPFEQDLLGFSPSVHARAKRVLARRHREFLPCGRCRPWRRRESAPARS